MQVLIFLLFRGNVGCKKKKRKRKRTTEQQQRKAGPHGFTVLVTQAVVCPVHEVKVPNEALKEKSGDRLHFSYHHQNSWKRMNPKKRSHHQHLWLNKIRMLSVLLLATSRRRSFSHCYYNNNNNIIMMCCE